MLGSEVSYQNYELVDPSTVAPKQPSIPRQSDRLLICPGVKARKSGLWLPVQLTVDVWSEIGTQLAAINDSSAWWLGDWLIYGKKKFPDRYKKAISQSSLDYKTLRNYAWVCGKFPIPRRRAALSFQHHAELASLPRDQQDEWLDKAEALGWSLHQLRRQLQAGGAGGRRRSDADMTIKLAVTLVQQDRWRTAAVSAGVDVQDWIIATLDDAAAPAVEG